MIEEDDGIQVTFLGVSVVGVRVDNEMRVSTACFSGGACCCRFSCCFPLVCRHICVC